VDRCRGREVIGLIEVVGLLGGTLMGWFFALNLAMFSPSGRPRPGVF